MKKDCPLSIVMMKFKDFKKGTFIKLIWNYFFWLIITVCLCIAVVLISKHNKPGTRIPVEIYSKVIKLVSYGWIAVTVHKAFKEMSENTAKKVGFHYDIVFWITLFITLLLIIPVLNFLCDCNKTILPKRFIGTSLKPFIENFVSLIPVMVMANANFRLGRFHTGWRSREHKSFLCLVDLPCLVAALTLFILVGIGMYRNLIIESNITPLLSGAMAFLVFITYVSDKMLQHSNELLRATKKTAKEKAKPAR